MDLKIINTINSIRKKDPKIYDNSTVWFDEEQEDDESDDEIDNEKSKIEKTKKKKTFKDVLRDQLLKQGADIETDINDEMTLGRSSRIAYDKEQEEIRQKFLSATKTEGDDNENDDTEEIDSENNFMKVRSKDPATLAKEELELQQSLEEMKELGKKNAKKEAKTAGKKSSKKGSGAQVVSENGRNIEDEKESKESVDAVDADAFLANYIVNKKWKAAKNLNINDDDLEDIDQDEEVSTITLKMFVELFSNDTMNICSDRHL